MWVCCECVWGVGVCVRVGVFHCRACTPHFRHFWGLGLGVFHSMSHAYMYQFVSLHLTKPWTLLPPPTHTHTMFPMQETSHLLLACAESHTNTKLLSFSTPPKTHKIQPLNPNPNPTPGDEAGAEELRKELLKAKAKLMAAMQRQAGE